MKRLVSLPLDPRQEEELLRLLNEAGIDYKETRTPARFIAGDAIWVADEDYPRAREILEREARRFAEAARARWNAEWEKEHGRSYARWLWHRARATSPEAWFKALLLIALVALMLLYPLALVL